MGVPSTYKPEYAQQAYRFCLLKNSTDAQLAQFFGVYEQTINDWKKQFPEFNESIKKGKDIADANVAASLYERAVGYSHPEEKIFLHEGEVIRVQTTKHYPPDTAAAFIWLKNRQRASGLWVDKPQVAETEEQQQVDVIEAARKFLYILQAGANAANKSKDVITIEQQQTQ
jgi:transposase-like protein